MTVGPTSDSRRAATVRAITGMLAITSDPETAKVLQAMAMMNMEGEGISDVREYFRKQLVRLGVLKPTEEEKQELDAADAKARQPTPDQAYLIAEAQKTIAEMEKTRAEAAKIMAEINPQQEEQKRQFDAFMMDTKAQIEAMRLEIARTNADAAEARAIMSVAGQAPG